jgi:dienelactone hydrolase
MSPPTPLTPKHDVCEDDPLDDFSRRSIVLRETEKAVYVAGSGPAVILMTEMPGISPEVARFARWIRDAGFTVYMPSLFGRDGAVPGVEEGLAVFKRACVSAEFRAFAVNEASPVTQWLRALATLAHAECGGPGVGAIGMCFTGNFALSMMLESATIAPIVMHPSIPLSSPGATGLPEEELAAVRKRIVAEDRTILAYRFEGDRFCTEQRFAAFKAALGERFVERVLPASAANPKPSPFFAHVVGCAHSVVTAHLVDGEGEPTIAARDEILAFLAEHLASRTRDAFTK